MRKPENPVAAAFRELSPEEVRLLESGLLDAARRAGQTPREVISVSRSPLDSSWYRTEAITIEFDSGEQLNCFVKDFGSYAREKNQMEARRERERFFYKHTFRNGEHGLPAYVADIWSDDVTWLVLEFVDAVPLAWCDLEIWYDAASWLGRWQTAVVDRLPTLRSSGHFIDRGPSYFSDVARGAQAGAEQLGDDVAQQVDAALPAYLAGTEALMQQPQTLVHGAFRPNQILVDTKEAPARICPTDWEIAAIGSCLYDLAALADGFGGTALETFMARFLSEATWLDDDSPTVTDLRLALRTCSTHRTLKWVAQAESRNFSSAQIRELAASLIEPAKELQS